MQQRSFIHSFPRPRAGESSEETLNRALSILSLIRRIGLVLAPEVVEWNFPTQKPLRTLQRRICFTEISNSELTEHCKTFGPLALSFNIEKLRESGAMPVMYVPQGLSSSLSQIANFCVNGAYHTRGVIDQLQKLKNTSDPEIVARTFGRPVDAGFTLNLQNTDSNGAVVASYPIPATHVQQLLMHVGFNNIPFDHSMGVLTVLLNMFYPTDNTHIDEQLGYYRQREWRLIAGDLVLNSQPIGRDLTSEEKAELSKVDPIFWNREIVVDGRTSSRIDFALVYEPIAGWDIFSALEYIQAPEISHNAIREIVGSEIQLFPL